jgi:WD40 repeat protein
VVTASWWDHAAFLWDVRTGLPLGEPLRHDDWVTYVAFSPDGRWVVTTSCDRTAKIWEVPMATSPAPSWLADLAEAVGGQRIDEEGVRRVVPLDDLWELRNRLLASTATDEYTRWAKWFFADRSSRPISPSASVAVAAISDR